MGDLYTYPPTLAGGGGGGVSSVTASPPLSSSGGTTPNIAISTTAFALTANNLSDLANEATARTNLGLGSLATQSGTFSGTSSGTNTGDQTITLTGAVTGSGTGSFATTLATQLTQTVMGNGSGSTAAPIALALTNANQIIATASALASTFVSGVSGGQTLTFGTASADNANYHSTSNATKGTHIFDGKIVQAVAGSASSASLQLAGGVNYGIYSDTATVGIVAGGVVGLHVRSNGQISMPNGVLWQDSGAAGISGTTANANQFQSYLYVTSSAATPTQTNGTSWEWNMTPISQVSASGSKWDGFKIDAVTATLTGGGGVSTATGFNLIDVEAPTITSTTATAITAPTATMTLKGPVAAGGSVTLSNPLTLWVQSGSTVLGNSTISTSATTGFVYVPACAGTPTGTPVTNGGTVPIVVDSTNSKAYIYSGGAWVSLN